MLLNQRSPACSTDLFFVLVLYLGAAIYLHQLCNDNAKVKSFELSLAKPAVGSMRKRMKLPSCAQFGVSVLVPATGDTLFQTVTCHKEDSVEFTRRVINDWFAEFKR